MPYAPAAQPFKGNSTEIFELMLCIQPASCYSTYYTHTYKYTTIYDKTNLNVD